MYQRSGLVTQLALVSLFTSLPGILLSPVAGALVDRWDRRRVLLWSDSASAVATVTIAGLLWVDRLPVWYVYLAVAVGSASSAFQWPAYAAATTQLVAKRDLGRAAGLRNLSQSASNLLAPALGGALLLAIGLRGILAIDFLTFLFAVSTLACVRIPRQEASAEGLQGRGSLWREAAQGWSFVRRRSGLVGLLVLAAVSNLAIGFVQVLVPPMVLAFASPAGLGTALSVAGAGTLAGSLAVGLWRGPRRLVRGILDFGIVCGLCIAAGGLRPSLALFTVAGFLYFFTFAVSGAYGQALWQVKVPPDLQGRVFAIRRLVGWSTFPLAYVAAGPLADRLFEPLLAAGGPLAGTAGLLVGTGRGRGIALLLVLTGLLLALSSAGAYLLPRVRRLEDELPDRIADPPPAAEAGR
jgi:MFS transporter, DHA3 family, macrolide efflux protein